MAERLCGTVDWLDQAGGARPCRRTWRASPSAPVVIVYDILQRAPDASVAGQRRADSARNSRRRPDRRKTPSRRTASSICPDLIYDRDTLSCYFGCECSAGPRGAFEGKWLGRPADGEKTIQCIEHHIVDEW